jgi:hypothetical protein
MIERMAARQYSEIEQLKRAAPSLRMPPCKSTPPKPLETRAAGNSLAQLLIDSRQLGSLRRSRLPLSALLFYVFSVFSVPPW